ncbi:8557_t:CDS:1, partial [Cetraspora pellucida]
MHRPKPSNIPIPPTYSSSIVNNYPTYPSTTTQHIHHPLSTTIQHIHRSLFTTIYISTVPRLQPSNISIIKLTCDST